MWAFSFAFKSNEKNFTNTKFQGSYQTGNKGRVAGLTLSRKFKNDTLLLQVIWGVHNNTGFVFKRHFLIAKVFYFQNTLGIATHIQFGILQARKLYRFITAAAVQIIPTTGGGSGRTRSKTLQNIHRAVAVNIQMHTEIGGKR